MTLAFDTSGYEVVRKGSLRFAIGHPAGITSNSWKVWANQKGDVYLVGRDNYRELKVSLHVSGRWRMGLTQEALRENPGLVSSDQDRVWGKWERPAESLPGAVRAFQVIFLPSQLAVRPEMRTSKVWAKNQVVVASAPPGSVNIATIWITQGEPTLQPEVGPVITLASFPLRRGRHAQTTVHIEPVVEASKQMLANAIEAGRREAQEAGLEIPDEGRFLFFGAAPDGCRFLVESNQYGEVAV
jgi:hypothetical protein